MIFQKFTANNTADQDIEKCPYLSCAVFFFHLPGKKKQIAHSSKENDIDLLFTCRFQQIIMRSVLTKKKGAQEKERNLFWDAMP